jgi:HlyD family secretion protein
MKRIVVGAVIVIALAVIVGMNVYRAREKAVEVDVAVIGRQDLVAKVSGSGRIEARKSVSTTSNVVGKVLEVAVEEGDSVERGQLILRIDPGERTTLVDQAKALLARAEAQATLAAAELRQAEVELQRTKDLIQRDLASEQDLEAAETLYDVRVANLAAVREDVRNAFARVSHADYELDKTIVRAEIAGVVVRLSVEEGENVLAGDLYNSGSAIVVVADLSEMEAQILVDETEVIGVAKGQDATVTVDAFPNRDIPGHVSEVGNSAYNAGPLGSQDAKDFLVRVRLDEVPESLRPGLSARAEIVTERREEALAVPIEALTVRNPRKEARLAKARGDADSDLPDEEVEGVFLVADGAAVFRAVETGIAGEKHFEVISGVDEGDEIVQAPFEAIRTLDSGDKIKLRKKKGRESEADPDSGEEPAVDPDAEAA